MYPAIGKCWQEELSAELQCKMWPWVKRDTIFKVTPFLWGWPESNEWSSQVPLPGFGRWLKGSLHTPSSLYNLLQLLFQIGYSAVSPVSNLVSFSHQCPQFLIFDLEGTDQFFSWTEISNSESAFQKPVFNF